MPKSRKRKGVRKPGPESRTKGKRASADPHAGQRWAKARVQPGPTARKFRVPKQFD